MDVLSAKGGGTSGNMMSRRDFMVGAATMAVGKPGVIPAEDEISAWQRDTELVSATTYSQYMADGDTRGLVALERLEAAAEKVLREAREAAVHDVPAVWSVYNMGYVVKTRESLFAIDLVHRRDAEFAPMLDFALVTHNHRDHWRSGFYRAMDGAGKTVVSNFLDNFGVRNWRRDGGYTRARKVFKFKDVEVRTSLVDHNDYLVDFTTAFEVKVGEWTLFHTGDAGLGTEHKLETAWGRPDLWLFFPGCGIDVKKAVGKVAAKRVVFGHLWELGHRHGHKGRLDEPLIRPRLVQAREAGCNDVSLAFWGDRIA